MFLPRTAYTLDEARSTLSGLHFAKDAVSDSEQWLLHIAEGLLRLVDQPTYVVEVSGGAEPVTRTIFADKEEAENHYNAEVTQAVAGERVECVAVHRNHAEVLLSRYVDCITVCTKENPTST